MKVTYKHVAGAVVIFITAGAIIEGEVKSPARIEHHVETRTVDQYPQRDFGYHAVAGTTASGDFLILDQEMAGRYYVYNMPKGYK
jgi:hypothetical protein